MSGTMYERIDVGEFTVPTYYLLVGKDGYTHRLIFLDEDEDDRKDLMGQFNIIARLDDKGALWKKDFEKKLSDHECVNFSMTEDVIYWHFSAKSRGFYWFDIVLTPSSLVISGDLYSNVFDRRGPEYWKDSSYIMGKCKTARQEPIIPYHELQWDEQFMMESEGLPTDYPFQLYLQTWAFSLMADKALEKVKEGAKEVVQPLAEK